MGTFLPGSLDLMLQTFPSSSSSPVVGKFISQQSRCLPTTALARPGLWRLRRTQMTDLGPGSLQLHVQCWAWGTACPCQPSSSFLPMVRQKAHSPLLCSRPELGLVGFPAPGLSDSLQLTCPRGCLGALSSPEHGMLPSLTWYQGWTGDLQA